MTTRKQAMQPSVWLTYLLFVLLFLTLTAALITLTQIIGNKSTDLRQTMDIGADSSLSQFSPISSYLFVVDAGHGGEDGGAVGYVNGVALPEKNINLAIATTLTELLRDAGATAIMTRDTDALLYDRNGAYEGKKKALDMAARLAVVESAKSKAEDENKQVIFVSIHQNTFSDPKYSGLQVYYSGNHDQSAVLAQIIQETARQHLAPDNHRATKVGQDIFLLKEIRSPAVLVECGFLSNPAECAALGTESYQNRVAYAIFCALRQYATKQVEKK